MNTSRGAIITLSSNPKPASDPQSEANEVILRRREQNRLAQKKHRSKARERIESQAQQRAQGRKLDTPSREQCPEPPPEPSQGSNPLPVPEDHVSGGIFTPESLWVGTEMNLAMDQMSSHQGQIIPDLGVSCFCTNIFGPCEFHRIAIRAECEAMAMNGMGDIDPMQTSPGQSIAEQYSDSAIGLIDPSPPYEATRERRSSEDKDNTTVRFEALLQDVKSAGFKTFDEAVTTYYTYKFQAFSAPDLAQKASRGRRLRQVLSDIEESAADWTFWEARGYKEKILQAAEVIYVEEMARLIERENMMSTEDGKEEDNLLSRPEPRFLDKLYQNEAPNLWALITSLAGDLGASSGTAALAALSLLSSSAQNPELNIAMQMNKLALRCNPGPTKSQFNRSSSSSTSSSWKSRSS